MGLDMCSHVLPAVSGPRGAALFCVAVQLSSCIGSLDGVHPQSWGYASGGWDPRGGRAAVGSGPRRVLKSGSWSE